MEADRRRRPPPRAAAARDRSPRGPRAQPRAKLDRDRDPAALARGRGDPDGQVVVGEQRRPGAGLADLADRTAHVDVDQVGAGLGDDRGRRAHHLRVLAEELDRDRVLVGMEAKQLLQGALVPVVEPEARDHLRDGQPGPVPPRLQPHEPVADPGQGGEQDAVGDLDVADPERGCEWRLHAVKCCARRSAAGRAG